jgi:membrane-bound metal-dependent hydrolase YbcI (DUF457 family)
VQQNSSTKKFLSPKPEVMLMYSGHHNFTHSQFSSFVFFFGLPFIAAIYAKATSTFASYEDKSGLNFFNSV